MKIFGKEFQTKKELRARIAQLEVDVLMACNERDMMGCELNVTKNTFPFELGQTVYDVQLRDEKGRYVRENASLEHSRINEVVVDEKNYFGLVERYRRQDVFKDYGTADAFLMDVCTNKK
jgi:hypothetical protein